MTKDNNGINHTNEQEHKEFCSTMIGFMDNGKPQLGIFWFDNSSKSLFGVEKIDSDKVPFINGKATIGKLHKTYWQKQHHRALKENNIDSIFYKEHNYTMIPRGQIFLDEQTLTYQVCVGHWIEDKDFDIQHFRVLLEDEFNLPENFEFVEDIQWNLGHGWSEEII